MLATLLDELGVQGWRLELNSVGSATDRARYVAALREALAPVKHQMWEDNQRRAETNPLRVLDSKAPETRPSSTPSPRSPTTSMTTRAPTSPRCSQRSIPAACRTPSIPD